MIPKCSVYIAASVDGFIARQDGDMGWLHRPEYAKAQLQGLSYERFITNIDAVVMGRHTFETVLSFRQWPYEGVLVVVLSSKHVSIPDRLTGRVRSESGAPDEIASRLAAAGMTHLYIDGGITIQRFLKARLIHEMTITRIPVLLGGGIPLFGATGVEQDLRLIDAAPSENGFVQERYEVLPAA